MSLMFSYSRGHVILSLMEVQKKKNHDKQVAEASVEADVLAKQKTEHF